MHAFLLGKFGVTCSYEKVSIPPCEFSSRAEELFSRFDGFNVTIPFKTDIIPYLKRLEGDALRFGAVNTVVSAGRTGYNTDGYGFLLMLESAGIEVRGNSVLVLGAGGAGRSCVGKLLEAGAEVFVYERDAARLKAVTAELGGTPLEEIPAREFGMILNCTGVGMHDTVGKTPAVRLAGGKSSCEELLGRCSAAADLIYEPAQSEFLRLAEALGKPTVNGASMLFYQAYAADCIFIDRTSDSAEARRLYREYEEDL